MSPVFPGTLSILDKIYNLISRHLAKCITGIFRHSFKPTADLQLIISLKKTAFILDKV